MFLRSIALSAALLLTATAFSSAQTYGGYGQPQYASNQAYQTGFQDGIADGQSDRQAGHSFRATKTDRYEDTPGYNPSFGDKNEYKAIYRQGYTAGYQQAFNGGYVQPPYGNNPVSQMGFQNGITDGQNDRQAGQSFRPTKTDKYADPPGYNSSFGDKNAYKAIYRQGYSAGYQQGYNGGYAQPPYPMYAPPYPASGQPGQAFQIGFQDGINDGMNDRQTGHSYRPTKTDKYEDAPGYNSSFGGKKEYKQIYRQGYAAGYRRGYGGHGD